MIIPDDFVAAFSSVFGLSSGVVAQILFYRLIQRSILSSLLFGGIVALLFAEAALLRCLSHPVELEYHLLSLMTTLFLMYGYFAFLNLGRTSVRLKILKEVTAARSLTNPQLQEQLGDERVLKERISRLQAANAIFFEAGSIKLKGRPRLILVSKAISFLRPVIMGSFGEKTVAVSMWNKAELAFVGVLNVLTLSSCCILLFLSRFPKKFEILNYVAGISIIPLTVFFGSILLEKRISQKQFEAMSFINWAWLCFTLLFAIVGVVTRELFGAQWDRIFIFLTLANCTFNMILIFRVLAWDVETTRIYENDTIFLRYFTAFNVLTLALFFSPFDRNQFPNPFLSSVFSSHHWAFGLVASTLLFPVAYWLTKRDFEVAPYWRYVYLVTLSLFLFDPEIVIDSNHLSANVGPGLRILNGGFPLVDAFCQYGIGPMLIPALALHLFPDSLFGFGFVNAILNVVQVGLFIAIAARVIQSNLVFFFGTLIVASFHHLAVGYNFGMTPSVAGMRYIPDLIFLLSLTYLKPGRSWSLFSMVSLLLSFFWSFESALNAVAAYSVFVVACNSRKSQAIRCLAVDFLRLLAILSGAIVAFSLTAYWATGHWPSLAPYLDAITAHTENRSVSWAIEISATFWTWIVFFLVLLAGLLISFTYIFSKREKLRDSSCWIHAKFVVPTTIVIGSQMLYFVGRSIPGLLVALIFPTALLFLHFIDSVSIRHEGPLYARRIVKLSALVLAFFMTATVLSRLHEPFSAYAGNSILIRKCFSKSGCAHLKAELKEKLFKASHDYQPAENKTPFVFGYYSQPARHLIHDMKDFVLAHGITDQETLLLLGPHTTYTSFYLKWSQYLGYSNTSNDSTSRTLIDRSLEKLSSRLPKYLVVRHPEHELTTIEYAALVWLRKHQVLCEVATEYQTFTFYRVGSMVTPCDTPAE